MSVGGLNSAIAGGLPERDLPPLQDGRGSTLTPVLGALAFLRRKISFRAVVRGDNFALTFPRGLAEDEQYCVWKEQPSNIIRAFPDAMGFFHFHLWRSHSNLGKAAAEPDPLHRWARMRHCD